MTPACHTKVMVGLPIPALVAVLAAPPANTIGLDLSAYGSGGQASGTMVLSPVLRAELAPWGYWTARVDWGLVYRHELSDTDADFGRVLSGNPALAAQRTFEWLGGAWRVGAGGAFPVARLRDGVVARRNDRNALAYASGMRANWDLWLWAPERGSLFIPAHATWRFAYGRVSGDAAVALLQPMGDFANARTDVVLQAAATVARTRAWLEGGLRAQLVVVATQPRDRVQWSAVPFVAAQLGRARVDIELTLPIGEPLGAFELWSLAAGVEVTL